MTLRIADKWFERRRVGSGITHLWEPYVDEFIRCNIWHICGRDRDMLVDTGLGIVSLRAAERDLFGKELTAVATHTHFDHIGGMHEFETRLVHEAESDILANAGEDMILKVSDFGAEAIQSMEAQGYTFPKDNLLTAKPDEMFTPDEHALRPAPPTATLSEGDILDLGDRHFEVLHLPGHSPGSIGLWEAEQRILFSGDAIYDGPLLYAMSDSNLEHYISTMERLLDLPVEIVHAGHDPSFGRERLKQIALRYLKLWGR